MDWPEEVLQDLDGAMMTSLHVRSLLFVGPLTYRYITGYSVALLSVEQIFQYLRAKFMIFEQILDTLISFF